MARVHLNIRNTIVAYHHCSVAIDDELQPELLGLQALR